MRRLQVLALLERFRRPGFGRDAGTLVQFVGFPRSGHSLIGALLDAHPNAAIAHELDIMGLVAKGMSAASIRSLIGRSARQFSDDGRWWNGFRYETPELSALSNEELTVIGDKKGDWATRWFAGDPSLIDKIRREIGLRTVFINVTRHPLDNIATMSLRKGRLYDRLRIEASDGEAFSTALQTAQEAGDIASHALDEMVTDYLALAAGVAAMKKAVPKDDWYEIVYEDFVEDCGASLSGLAGFLGLTSQADWLAAANTLVRSGGSKSRDRVSWTDDQRNLIREAIQTYDFLRPYSDD
ncbi:sulfotransferase [Parvularcula mediterranea]|nr:sulfotransferase [Parvularcula mediterranea]